MKKILIAILVVVGWGLWGCGQAPQHDDLCQQAANHVATCLGEAPRQLSAWGPSARGLKSRSV